MRRRRHPLALACALVLSACAGESDVASDGRDDSFGSGKADGAIDPDSDEARAVLALVNDPAIDRATLDDDVGLDARAARGIIEHRDGTDAIAGSDDDDRFDDLAELDAVPFVGRIAFERLLEYATDHGYLVPAPASDIDVVFSPQAIENSHNARVAQLIDGAQHSLDIAMYSFSDAGINRALTEAAARGVHIRFLFDTASEDRKLAGAALASSKSGRLEAAGIDVRWVNKIMHHKFMIVDGPRDLATAADTATLVSGSANWSGGAATRYDENTLFMVGQRELNLRMQREFDLMWEHSRDLVANPAIVTEHATLAITDELIGDDASVDAFFTSANFRIQGTDTFVTEGRNTIADQWVAAIDGATTSIHIASGHLRSRPVSEALMHKVAEHPEVEILIYLDGQEYISAATHDAQLEDLEACRVAAGTSATKLRDCNDSGFLFGFMVGEAGAHVRYKYYAYRWSAIYATQMHHKYMVVDGDELYTGSYNLSDNAEHNTFENMLHFAGPQHAGLVAAYEANFATMWETGRADDGLAAFRAEVESLATPLVPLVFPSLALEWSEVTDLKDLLRDACPLVNSTPFRSHPEAHLVCQ